MGGLRDEARRERLYLEMVTGNWLKVYLDWNVFNAIEKKRDEQNIAIANQLEWLEGHIMQEGILVPYSNAHLNDLYRGYLKNKSFTAGHLETLERLTAQLCLTQYWGAKDAKWHYRPVKEFFERWVEENELLSPDFAGLFDRGDDDELGALAARLHSLRCAMLERQTIPKSFSQVYKSDPIFNIIYPRTKTAMNVLALCEDLYAFTNRIKTDYTLYKSYRKYLIQLKVKFPALTQSADVMKAIRNTEKDVPVPLTWDETWEVIKIDQHPGTNAMYDKFMDRFTKTDLKGYRPDERFANMIDDALHSFYGAHCDYFITNDSRCYDKARKVYQELGIRTEVMNVDEYVGRWL